MKKLLIFFVSRFLKPFINAYVSRPTAYRYKNLRIIVLPGVFHPRFFFSTRFLLRYLQSVQLKGKAFLELGAGSGLISLYAAQKGARVTACDISRVSVDNVKQNQVLNKLAFPVLYSDLFSALAPQAFDVIVINPPYYKKDPVTDADHAWYCGENSQYFAKLFASLHHFIHKQSQVIMVLSDVCNVPLIISLAKQHQLDMKLVRQRNFLLEKNFIYHIQSL